MRETDEGGPAAVATLLQGPPREGWDRESHVQARECAFSFSTVAHLSRLDLLALASVTM